MDPEPRLDLEALEREARDRLDEGAYDYYAAGAGDESTLRANLDAWERLRLLPRVLCDVAAVSTATTLLGTPVETPVVVAPMALHRLLHPDGELAVRRAAAAAGALLVVSTRSSTPIDEVAAAADSPWWFQVYILRDRGLTEQLVRRAVDGGAGALVLTGDTPILGWKRRPAADFSVPGEWIMPGLSLPDGMPVEDQFPGNVQDSAITFDDIAWLAELSELPVVVKGVLRADDARRCVDAGAAAVLVSNHGGRQLDGAIASAEALPEVADAVGGDCEIYVDGGLRRGTDVLRALALGARAVLVGRPVAWGLATGGAAGAQRVLAGLTLEFAEALALVGATHPDEVKRDLVRSSLAD